MQVYLDNSATTPLNEQVKEAMEPYFSQKFGNPSSPHSFGGEVEKVINNCKDFIAQALNIYPTEIIFTSGGTEANNLALQGLTRSYNEPGHIITSQIEHPSVLEVTAYLERCQGWAVTYLPVDKQGRICLEELRNSIKPTTKLVSIMMVNNETGVINDIHAIGNLLKKHTTQQGKIAFHVDAVQAFGNVNLKVKESSIDLLTLSGHKIGGPKGIGVLIHRNNVQLKPLVFGGGQEGGLRSGTENVPGIVGITKSFQIKAEQDTTHLLNLKNSLIKGINEIKGSFINTPQQSAPHIINVGFKGVPAEVLVNFLEEKNIYVSMGAACSSKKRLSHVLEAIGLPENDIRTSIRISLSTALTDQQIAYAVEKLKENIQELREIYNYKEKS